MKEIHPLAARAHDLYYHRGRILKRLTNASVKGLARFADAIEVLSDEELDLIAFECERMAIKKMEKSSLKDGL